MAMAAFPSKFTKCEPGEAHDRLFNEVFGNNDHPYTVMWRAVEWFYTHQGWQHLANYEITDKFAVAFRNGFQYRNTRVYVNIFVFAFSSGMNGYIA